VLDQLAVRGVADETVAAVKIAAHMAGFGVPLLVALLPASALLGLSGATLQQLAIGLAIAFPALASLAVMTAALTANQRGGGAIGGLLLLPLSVPVLIFGAGMLNPVGAGGGALKLLVASALLLTAIGPFAAGAALRALRE
jgi:heme exporter protein B